LKVPEEEILKFVYHLLIPRAVDDYYEIENNMTNFHG
jgi:hypothetical protein